MSHSVCVLGRQSSIGLAELEALFGASKVIPLQNGAVLIEADHSAIPFQRLGGSLKLAKMLTRLDTTDWGAIEKYLKDSVPEHLKYLPEGKFKLGLSVYGLDVSTSRLSASLLSLKKIIKASGRSVRIIPNKDKELNAAQVIHNQLTGPTGWELLLIKDGRQTVLAQTKAVQNIDAYAARDQARPKRDAKVGMLPPKLAQIITNLAAGPINNHAPIATVLDPFCGTGVVLQEAVLMGYNVYGTDLEPRMIDYADANLDWLRVESIEKRLHQADATNALWEKPFDLVAAETYLGRPLSSSPRPEILNEIVRDVDTILRKFLKNLAQQTTPGFRLCIAVPAWRTKYGFKRLPMLDHLTDMGYNRLSFVHVRNEDLIYNRENQMVGRELVVLIRK